MAVLISGIVLAKQLQPLVEAYSTIQLARRVEDLAKNQSKTRIEILNRLDRLEENIEEKKYEMDKDLVRETVRLLIESR